MFKSTNLLFAYFLIFIVALIGCATGGPQKTTDIAQRISIQEIGKDYDFRQSSNKSIVIGKIDVKRKGWVPLPSYNLLLEKVGAAPSLKKYSLDLSSGEFFFIALEPGEYKITDFIGGGGMLKMQEYSISSLTLLFNVGPEEVVYIGTLILNIKLRSTGFGGAVVDKQQIRILDEYVMAAQEFKQRYVNATSINIKKYLITSVLIDALQNKERKVRINSADTLGDIGDIEAVEPLITLLSDEEWLVRFSAVRALGKIGDVRAIEPLEILDKNESNNMVRNAIQRILGELQQHHTK